MTVQIHGSGIEVKGEQWCVGDIGIHEKDDFVFLLTHYAGCSEWLVAGKFGLAFKPRDLAELKQFLSESEYIGSIYEDEGLRKRMDL